MKQALIIIDIQNDYFEGGKLPLKNSTKSATNASNALKYCRSNNIDVIHIQHIDTQKLLPIFQPDTPGVEIHPLVGPTKGEPHFIKHTPNAFHQTGLLDFLQKKSITHLIICGMMTHMCVNATVRAAKDFGYSVCVLADACATSDMKIENKTIDSEWIHAVFIEALGQYYAEIISTETFLSREIEALSDQ